MIYNAKQLANQLKLIRTGRGLTQAQLAERVGIKQATLSSFETSPETTQLQTMFKIVQALELNLDIYERSQHTENSTSSDEDW